MKLLKILMWIARAVVTFATGREAVKVAREWTPAPPCRASSPWPGVFCTRDKGHDGQHAGRDPDAPRDDWHRSRAWSSPELP